MKRWQALALIVVLWGAIYLPGLGSTEIKGEEGRRILPARTMLATGNWLVPHIGGEPYLRKPPLLNWLVAISFGTFRSINEWTARLPSVLSILALALVSVGVVSPWLGVEAAFTAAILMMTHLGTLEKGRLAEIEALYVALSGIAMVVWLAWFATGRSRWLTWTVPFAFLGLGLLTKAPLHLLFFYAIVVPTAIQAGRARELRSLPHLTGVLLMLAIFAVWAVPYYAATKELNAAQIWSDQFAGRISHNKFDLPAWLLSIPRGLSNFVPWVVFVPLLWGRRIVADGTDGDGALLRRVWWAVAICFIGLLVVPGVLPRYTLPLLIPASLLVAVAVERASKKGTAWVFTSWAFTAFLALGIATGAAIGGLLRTGAWWGYAAGAILACAAGSFLILKTRLPRTPVPLALCSAISVGLAMIAFTLLIVPKMNAADDVRPFGRAVNAALPVGEPLYVVDPGFQPALFYLRDEPRSVSSLKAVPAAGGWLLVRKNLLGECRRRWPAVHKAATVADKNGHCFFLLHVAAERSG